MKSLWDIKRIPTSKAGLFVKATFTTDIVPDEDAIDLRSTEEHPWYLPQDWTEETP